MLVLYSDNPTKSTTGFFCKIALKAKPMEAEKGPYE